MNYRIREKPRLNWSGIFPRPFQAVITFICRVITYRAYTVYFLCFLLCFSAKTMRPNGQFAVS